MTIQVLPELPLNQERAGLSAWIVFVFDYLTNGKSLFIALAQPAHATSKKKTFHPQSVQVTIYESVHKCEHVRTYTYIHRYKYIDLIVYLSCGPSH